MNIAIIGAGNVGRALGWNWSGRGHGVIFGVPEPKQDKYAEFIERLPGKAQVMKPAEAAGQGEIIVLATPWPATQNAIESLGDLGGKLLIDCTNPLAMTEHGLALDRGFSESGGEQVAQWAGTARVVKSLNQVGAEVMADPSGFPAKPVMFVAGDDTKSKTAAAAIITELGFEVLDAGNLQMSRILEPFAMVWINQALLRGKGRNWAFGALERRLELDRN